MTLRTRIICAALLVASSASLANTRPMHGQGFAVVDHKTGTEIFNDGVDDNKVCAAKKVTKWDPAKQEFVDTMQKVKCNF